MSVEPNHVQEVENSWKKVAALGVENVGVLLFKNILLMIVALLVQESASAFQRTPPPPHSPKLFPSPQTVLSP